jgi:hypothetical protein
MNLVTAASSLLFRDVNGDRLPDLVACGLNGDIGVSLGQANGALAAPQLYMAGFSCSGVFAGQISTTGGIGLAAVTEQVLFGVPSEYSVTEILDPSGRATPRGPILRPGLH